MKNNSMDHAYLNEKNEVVPLEVFTEDHKVNTENMEIWGRHFAKSRRVNGTQLSVWFRPVNISTVFLGLNHSWCEHKPLWFETMIFGGKFDEYQERYTTYDEAVEGHKKAVHKVLNHQKVQIATVTIVLTVVAAFAKYFFDVLS